jgi:hypothetical protein
MSRREAFIKVGYLAGGALSAGTLSTLMTSCASNGNASSGWRPQVVPRDQVGVLEGLVDGIIPATDTPGAVDAGVPEFFDLMLRDYFTEEARDLVIAGLQGVDANCRQVYGSAWSDLDATQRADMVARLDRAAFDERQRGAGTPHFFGIVKEMTLWGYFSSEAGASQLQRFEISPGPFEGCIDFAEVGRPWTFFVSPPDLDDYFV